MSNFIAINSLGKKYSVNLSSNMKTNSEKINDINDARALKLFANSKRAGRIAKMEKRMENNIAPDKALERLEQGDDVKVKEFIVEIKSNTNALAREYGLPEPNNVEALAHDRLHCFTCDRKLHSPNAYKQGDVLFKDEEVRMLCCWCFGKMNDSDIKTTMRSDKDATREIRLAVYDPEESSKVEIEALTETRRIYLKAKMNKWEKVVSMVGNVKHDQLQDSNWIENAVLFNAKTRYNACTL